jgi:hypothetical protein
MARAKGKAVKLKEQDGIIYFKAIQPLTDEQYKVLLDMLSYNEEKSGLKLVLVPFSLAISNEQGE